jgi:hypothetical protein
MKPLLVVIIWIATGAPATVGVRFEACLSYRCDSCRYSNDGESEHGQSQ